MHRRPDGASSIWPCSTSTVPHRYAHLLSLLGKEMAQTVGKSNLCLPYTQPALGVGEQMALASLFQ